MLRGLMVHRYFTTLSMTLNTRLASTLLIGITASSIVYSTSVSASFTFPSVWRDIYPDSTSDQISTEGCQLCHRDTSGGSPWNAYGWRIRQVFNGNGGDIVNAIEEAENIDSDADPSNRRSIDEINYNFQPGWTAGANNTIYFANGSTQENQLPPSLPAATGYDWPVSSITDPITGDVDDGVIGISTVEVATDFNAPVKAVKAPGINGSLFVVEQTGRIFRVDLETGDKTLFFDMTSELVDLNDNYDERGLLGLAFHPGFASNGLFYTYHSGPPDVGDLTFTALQSPDHRSVVTAYQASNPSCNSSIAKIRNLLVFDQPEFNHNGGDLAFGQDGLLYVSVGDGGGADDDDHGENDLGNGRDTTTPLGTILRINPTGNNSNNGQYGIPASNPFVDASNGEVEEIFAYGFRNPYRFSFDAQTGELYAADVGQNQIEEIDIVSNGGDYGWNRKEGSFYFYNPSDGDDSFISNTAPPSQPSNLVDPIAEYDHDTGRSITGGYVYRGDRIVNLQGRYVFADYFRRLFYLDDNNTILNFSLGSQTNDLIAGFGQDADRELYILTNETFAPVDVTGKLLKITSFGASSPAPSGEGESAQCPPSEDMCLPIRASNGNLAVVCL